jgi:hypothetical protein
MLYWAALFGLLGFAYIFLLYKMNALIVALTQSRKEKRALVVELVRTQEKEVALQKALDRVALTRATLLRCIRDAGTTDEKMGCVMTWIEEALGDE